MGGLADTLAVEQQGKAQRVERDADAWASLLGRMLGGVDRFEVSVVPWPGRDDVKVGLRLLSDYDLAEAETHARAWAQARAVEAGRGRYDDREFVARYGAELVARALVSPDSGQRLVPGVDQLRQMITREECDALVVALEDHQETMAPLPHQLSDEDIERLAEAVKRPDPFRERALATCAPSTLRRLVRCMVDRQSKSTGSPCSPTTPPTGDTSKT